MSVHSTTIRLELEKRLCGHCHQTIYRFSTRERWKHVVPNLEWSDLYGWHEAAPVEEAQS